MSVLEMYGTLSAQSRSGLLLGSPSVVILYMFVIQKWNELCTFIFISRDILVAQ
jgi:hypothetical protein